MSAKCIDKNRLKLTWLHDNYKTQTCLVAMWLIAGKSILGFTICQNSMTSDIEMAHWIRRCYFRNTMEM